MPVDPSYCGSVRPFISMKTSQSIEGRLTDDRGAFDRSIHAKRVNLSTHDLTIRILYHIPSIFDHKNYKYLFVYGMKHSSIFFVT